MTAVIMIGKECKQIPSGQTIEQAMLVIDAYPDAFLFLINGVPVPMDTPIEDGMTVKAVKVASGG